MSPGRSLCPWAESRGVGTAPPDGLADGDAPPPAEKGAGAGASEPACPIAWAAVPKGVGAWAAD